MIQRGSWPIFSPNPSMLLALLFCRGKLVFAIPMAWFEGELVFHLVYLCHFSFLLHFLSYSSFTSLYLVNYACYYARMSSNEM
jgi:hypothetical protein